MTGRSLTRNAALYRVCVGGGRAAPCTPRGTSAHAGGEEPPAFRTRRPAVARGPRVSTAAPHGAGPSPAQGLAVSRLTGAGAVGPAGARRGRGRGGRLQGLPLFGSDAQQWPAGGLLCSAAVGDCAATPCGWERAFVGPRGFWAAVRYLRRGCPLRASLVSVTCVAGVRYFSVTCVAVVRYLRRGCPLLASQG